MPDEAPTERGLEPIGKEDDDIVARYRQLQGEGADRDAAIAKVGTEFGREQDEVAQIVLGPEELDQLDEEWAASGVPSAQEAAGAGEASAAPTSEAPALGEPPAQAPAAASAPSVAQPAPVAPQTPAPQAPAPDSQAAPETDDPAASNATG